MSAFLRGALFGAGLVGAFFAGYVLRNPPSFRSESTPALAQEVAKPVSAKPVSGPPVVDLPPIPAKTTQRPFVAPPIQLVSTSKEQYTPKIDFEKLTPPALDAEADFTPNDVVLQGIRMQLGIDTSSLRPPEPVPAVLEEAKKNDIRIPDLSPVLRIGIGPTPRPDLPPPPVIDVPEIRKPKLVVKRRDVELDFEVSKSGFSPITSVELWVTRDGGKNWKKNGARSNGNSPYRTMLGDDGDYGFRLVLVSETGKRSVEPCAGHSPDFQFELDTTPPTVMIFSPEAIRGASNRIKVRWSMFDKNPSVEGLQLDYSLDGETWIAIHSTPVPGDSFDWTLPKGIAPHVFIKITAKDAAGNVGVAATSSKVAIDLVVPEAKITGLRDENAKPEVGPRPRVIE